MRRRTPQVEPKMRETGVITTAVLLALVPLAGGGCENIALLPRPSLDSQSRIENVQLSGSVEAVDLDRQEIYLLTEARQSQIVSYTDETRVLVEGREARASTIHAGDVIEVRLRAGGGGRAIADVVQVRQRGRVGQTIEGTVERVLTERGAIELRRPSGELTIVYLPPGSSSRTEEQFQRLRPGDFVRMEGVFLGENRFELAELI